MRLPGSDYPGAGPQTADDHKYREGYINLLKSTDYGPDYELQKGDIGGELKSFMTFSSKIYQFVDRWLDRTHGFITAFRPREKEKWYHLKLPRVPTIDECDDQDRVCFFEANSQFFRDRKVDSNILRILKRRYDDCELYYGRTKVAVMPFASSNEEIVGYERCRPFELDYRRAETNFFIKYGDLGMHGNVIDAYMKQKHRILWEDQNGPVGSGIKNTVSLNDVPDVYTNPGLKVVAMTALESNGGK